MLYERIPTKKKEAFELEQVMLALFQQCAYAFFLLPHFGDVYEGNYVLNLSLLVEEILQSF